MVEFLSSDTWHKDNDLGERVDQLMANNKGRGSQLKVDADHLTVGDIERED